MEPHDPTPAPEGGADSAGVSPFALDAAPTVPDSAPDSAQPPRFNPWTFSIGSILLVMLLVAVILALFRYLPAVGILVLVLFAPAALRTACIVRLKKQLGVAFTLSQKLVAFLGSLGVVVGMTLAVGVVFYGTCWVGVLGVTSIADNSGSNSLDSLGVGMVVGIILGIITGAIVLGLLIRWCWCKNVF
jgi:hypothetical protein